jgi:hypothetical protein
MRDIRSDLQERSNLIEEQITAVVAHFEKAVDQLQSERDARLAELETELAALGALLEAEHRRLPQGPRPMEPERQRTSDGPRLMEPERQRTSDGPRLMETERQRAPDGPRLMALPRQSLADFLARKLAESGPRSKDDLSGFAVQEGYFPDSEHASSGVHATLVELLRGERISQLPDGRLAPASLSQMIRLRQPA